MIQIRIAKEEDAAELAAFSERTFRHTFSGFNSEKDMNMYTSQAYSQGQQLKEILSPDRVVALIYEEKKLVGYYQLIKNSRTPSVSDPEPIELSRIYVDSDFHGKGIASTLMDHAIKKARSLGYKTLWLGVWEKNQKALAFYKKYSFRSVGNHVFVLGEDPQNDLILEKTL